MNRARNTGTVAQGAASRLLRLAVQLLGTIVQAVQTRAELLTTEVEEEFERVGRVLLLGMATLLAGILGALIAGFVVVLVFWDAHRLAAALAVRRELRARPRRLLEATLTELARDVAWLRRQP